ncbi:hypothetical protein KCV07_g9328, partial [Aureobasidium melanogenum]
MSVPFAHTALRPMNAPLITVRPREEEMIVSYTRHRRSTNDVTYTSQFPLVARIKSVTPGNVVGGIQLVPAEQRFLEGLKYMLRDVLEIDGDDYSVVWRMSETGQIAFVNFMHSFDVAVLDHKNANKKIIQLFVVSNDNIHDLPSLDFPK